ncbi:hypothetical protein HYS54_02665 [Candidatus Micrarchaeota archaeon]|nr:hypothetical protein [Candidatus Micrarchaeota archaeon]
MPVYRVFIEPEFEVNLSKLPRFELERIKKIRDQLKENPYAGKPLGYDWFREKRLNGNRLYYLVYESLKAVLVVTMSDKKAQQLTIEAIKLALNKYRKEIEDALRSTL